MQLVRSQLRPSPKRRMQGTDMVDMAGTDMVDMAMVVVGKPSKLIPSQRRQREAMGMAAMVVDTAATAMVGVGNPRSPMRLMVSTDMAAIGMVATMGMAAMAMVVEGNPRKPRAAMDMGDMDMVAAMGMVTVALAMVEDGMPRQMLSPRRQRQAVEAITEAATTVEQPTGMYSIVSIDQIVV